jgi:hypothetical protein
VRSYGRADVVRHVRREDRRLAAPEKAEDAPEPGRRVGFYCATGRIQFFWELTAGDSPDTTPVGWAHAARPAVPWGTDETFWKRRGFSFYWDATTRFLTVPAWAVAIPAAVPPTFALVRMLRRWARARRRLCPRCGYDLRATPDRCPECGHTPAGATA